VEFDGNLEVTPTQANRENDVSVDRTRDTIIQHTIDEELDSDDQIRKEKVKKYYPTFWDILGQRSLFGISYRLLLLIFLNVFAFLLLIILIVRFTGQNQAGSDSLNNSNPADTFNLANTTTMDVSVNISSTENEPEPKAEDDNSSKDYINKNKADNSNSKLRSLCDEDGITVADGVILTANQLMEKGEYFCSPSKTYMIGMLDDLAIVDIIANEVVWSAGVEEGARVVLQEDGTMIIEDDNGETLWNTEPIPRSVGIFNRQLVFWENNEGVIAIQQIPTIGATQTPMNFWMDGLPEFQYCDDCPTEGLEFPVRGTFYSPTFDDTERAWRDGNNNLPMHFPSLGWYSSSDPDVAIAHVEGMEYGKIDLAIASWDGPGTNFDRSRMTMLLEETTKQDANLKWTVYYEAESRDRPISREIRSDLEYLKKWFVWKNAWAHVHGKPVIYVNNNSGCDVAERWMKDAATDWYVVLRVFDRYESCQYQPDSWHGRNVNFDNDGIDVEEGLYYNLAPGQWRSGRPRPQLERLSPREWCDHVEGMVDSQEQWQLIVSFNEALLGTSIEPSLDWRSGSAYGFYLDCLHDPQMF